MPSFGTIQVLGKENIQPDFLEVRLAEVKKKKHRKTGETAILIKAVYEMIDKRAISPVTSLEVYSYSLFLGISKKKWLSVYLRSGKQALHVPYSI